MIIGIDFDNTIVSYDAIFYKMAREGGLIPDTAGAGKEQIRNFLRQAGREDHWTRLQGLVYGEGIKACPAFPGVMDFLRACRAKSFKTLIISHKTLHPILGPALDLHGAARGWLRDNGFYETQDTGIAPGDANFLPTKREKLELIAGSRCDFFIDDLPEFLGEPGFPAGTKKILFDPNNSGRQDAGYIKANSWEQIGTIIFGS